MANRVRTVATKVREADHDRTVDADRADVRKGRDRASRNGTMAGRTIAAGVVSAANTADEVCIRVPGVADEAVRMASGSVRRPTRLSIIRARPM